jgi:hypothetical protein
VRWRRLDRAAIIGGMLRSAFLTTTALFLAACSQEHERAANARFRLVAAGAATAQPLLAAHAEATAVLLADARLGVDLASARMRRVPQLVQFGEASTTASQGLAAGQIEAAVVCRDEGAAAADLALLAVTGHTIPMRAPLGVHALTAADAAAGGRPSPAPGDFDLALRRRAHADVLTTDPTTDVVFRIGVVAADELPWTASRHADVVAAIRRYPQCEVDAGPPALSPDAAAARAVELVHANAAALIVVASTRSPLRDARRAARTAKIPVLLVGHAPAVDDDALTCWVGADDQAMATATVSVLQQLAPDGGEVVDAIGTALPAAVRTAIEATRAPAAR